LYYNLLRAGPLGIEPRSSVLETDVLPLNYGPMYSWWLLDCSLQQERKASNRDGDSCKL
jgi:hypothetical protein